jgi:mannose-6-phosphate isomerase-like protein (cupin superfamily)
MSELFLEIETDRNHNGDGLSVLAADESNLPIVVRKRQRKKMITPWGAVHEMLSPDLQHKIEFILIQQPVGTRVSELYAHEGEECGLVLEGRFKGIFGEHEFILEPGDSIYYDSSIPHRWENGGDVEVKAIWAITPPSF